MNEFLLKYNFTITFSVEILAAVTGLLFYYKYKQTVAKYFIYFLIYLSVCDFSNSYVFYIKDGFLSFLKGTVFIWNFWFSTLFWNIGAIVFFAFYYSKILKTGTYKRIVKKSGYIFFMFSIMYILLNWNDFFIRFFPIISLLGAIIIFLCCVFYFIEIIQSDRILTFYKSLNFYISSTIFIWWLIITPIVFYDSYIYHPQGSGKDLDYMNLRRYIYLFSNICMYTTFTFALIFCKPDVDNI